MGGVVTIRWVSSDDVIAWKDVPEVQALPDNVEWVIAIHDNDWDHICIIHRCRDGWHNVYTLEHQCSVCSEFAPEEYQFLVELCEWTS